MSSTAATDSSAPPLHTIPTLSDTVLTAQVPQALQAVLQGRLAEKAQLDEMAMHLLEKLRPEVEQMVTQTVRSALRSAWMDRAEKYNDLSPSFDAAHDRSI
jgi:hypothetical protein